jgi:hypothetical protein
MRILIFLITMLVFHVAYAQQQPEQALEDIAEEQETGIEDDSFLQQLEIFKQHPVSLNTATAAELSNLSLLNAIQIRALIQYRELLGRLINVYELQAIPYWDVVTIQKMLPYVTITEPMPVLMKGSGTLLARFSKKSMLRYRYNFKNTLQYGILANKDDNTNYSFHVFARKLGVIQSLALGDFTVNMGQGLIQWQTLSLGKSGEITGAKRQSAILRPYNSAGRYNFHRGVAISLQRRRLSATAFASLRKLDANLAIDSAGQQVITSFITSGPIRNNIKQQTLGGSVAYDHPLWHVGGNVIHYNFSNSIEKRDEPYNLFSLRGRQLTNYSLDYDYTLRNFHGFGEVAASSIKGLAMVHGILISLDRRVDVSLVSRYLTPAFQSLYSRAFTESSVPSNESGAFFGLTLKPGCGLIINMYADIFRFPWLRSQTDAPSFGRDYQLQLDWQAGKKLEINSRLRLKTKQSNTHLDDDQFNWVFLSSKTNWRFHISWQPTPALMLRQRVELVWFNRNKLGAEQGYLIFDDAVINPRSGMLGFGARLEFFETSGFNSRIYVFENDVPSSYSVHAVYHKGFRYYINLSLDFSSVSITHKMRKIPHIQAHIRWAQIINQMQSGTDFQATAPGEFKLELIFSKL